MRAFIFILSLFGVLISAPAATETNAEYLIFTHQSRHQAFEWHFYFSRMLATPEWNAEIDKIPLAPDKAWQIARSWFKTYSCDHPELVSIEIRPFIRESEAGHIDKRLAKRFYYRIHCVPAYLDTMYVYILMDGTVVEPTEKPVKDLW